MQDRTLALAGIVQAAVLVKQISSRGYCQHTEFLELIYSALNTNPNTTKDTFANWKNLAFGLKALKNILDIKHKSKDTEVIRYTMSMIHLQKEIIKRPEVINKITREIQQVKNKSHNLELDDPHIIQGLASVYTNNISNLRYKIHITGNSNNLIKLENLTNIRALLLCGIRCAFLWRQVGGSRWNLLFQRNVMLASITQILEEIEEKSLIS